MSDKPNITLDIEAPSDCRVHAEIESDAAPTAAPAEESSASPRVVELHDKIEGLESDLFDAVGVAYRRGAVEWTRLNYPAWYERLKVGGGQPERLVPVSLEVAIWHPISTAPKDGTSILTYPHYAVTHWTNERVGGVPGWAGRWGVGWEAYDHLKPDPSHWMPLPGPPGTETQAEARSPHPVAWRCKDFADGWIIYQQESAAAACRAETGCLVEPLYTLPTPPKAEGK